MEPNDHSMISTSEDAYNRESMTNQPYKTQWTRRKLIITWSNTGGLLIYKKEIDQVSLLGNGYLWKQLDHIKKTIIDDLI
jgi:hypothetical protein